MSVQAMTWAFDVDLGTHYAAKILLLALANHAGRDGTCFPGRETLSEETGISARSLTRQVAFLESLGLITRERRMRGNTRTSDRYVLHMENSEDANLAHAKSMQKTASEGANCGVFIEESNRKKEEPLDNNSPKGEKFGVYSSDFNDEFWSQYPNTKNSSKKEAYSEWKKLSKDKRRQAIESLPSFQAYCRTNEWYTPIHACRYLKREVFETHMSGSATGGESIEDLRAIMQA